jgi:tRNA(Ile)-lysidine synthase TilS/MesJ
VIRYCVNCLLPETKPDLSFDIHGVCSACTAFQARGEVDWAARREELVELLAKYRSEAETSWDCIVPVSGGKDSTYQVLQLLE